ncbi:sigma-70 family RNA polymerase sigma factor [Streptosporangium sp. KLBMP 9127]|nr:sigma-70 family RNA polymerase sigma factor [Streptosporangium sp. KLBMP 9127]
MVAEESVAALVGRAGQGDKDAWDEIVERYSPLVWGVCRRHRLSRHDADDVGQGVWLRLVEQLPRLRIPAALPGWLATTTRRECLRVLRLKETREGYEDGADLETLVDGGAADVDGDLLAAERRLALRAAFARLPPQCRRLLGLLLQDPPVPYSRISAELEMPVGSIGPNRARCLAALRRAPELAGLIGAER